MKKKIIIIGIVLLIVALIIYFYYKNKNKNINPKTGKPYQQTYTDKPQIFGKQPDGPVNYPTADPSKYQTTHQEYSPLLNKYVTAPDTPNPLPLDNPLSALGATSNFQAVLKDQEAQIAEKGYIE
jgi:hypothetical protein